MERDSRLFEDAIASRVLMVTPTTLIALAKAVAFGWRQEQVAENAAMIADLGRDLYKRLSTMGDKIVSMGDSLGSSVGSYNDFIGSLEGSVMPQARRFTELQVEGTAKPLPALKLIETDIREVRVDRDMVFGGEAAASSAGIAVLSCRYAAELDAIQCASGYCAVPSSNPRSAVSLPAMWHKYPRRGCDESAGELPHIVHVGSCQGIPLIFRTAFFTCDSADRRVSLIFYEASIVLICVNIIQNLYGWFSCRSGASRCCRHERRRSSCRNLEHRIRGLSQRTGHSRRRACGVDRRSCGWPRELHR
jgi:hypothetical protein